MRALSLFGPGELRALRVNDTRIFPIIVERLQANVSDCGGAATSQMMSQALDSLRAVELVPPRWFVDSDDAHATTIIERYAATITELKGHLPAHLLCPTDRHGYHPPVLARCTRLEVLTHASQYTPAVWLGLSQLHTLHDVDLNKVSVAAVAAALPRLHTLSATSSPADSAAVAGFFTDLLPQLRVFRFRGRWPAPAAEEAAVTPTAPPPPLPLLKELEWHEFHSTNHLAQPTVLRGFLGARPTVLSAPYDLIAECLQGRVAGAPDDLASNLLTRVCDLQVLLSAVTASFDVTAMSQALLAAPQLRAFGMLTIVQTATHVHGDTSWLTSSAAPLPQAFVGLVHPRLRYVDVELPPGRPPPRDVGCAARLRRICFPRLRELRVNDETFFVAD
jgi:hypothetical protein